MEYSEGFKEFVAKGCYVGIGNPNAKILFIGKESANKSEEYDNNAKEWEDHIKNKTCQCLSYSVADNHKEDYIKKNWGKHTWSKYQKLTDFILDKNSEKYKIDFLEKVFTTEINDNPNKNTKDACKVGLDERKKIFKDTDFLKQFPVIVLACSDYLKNNDSIREIDEIFDVTFEYGNREYSKGNWFYVHYNSDKTKIVIHTRQLSMNVDHKLLLDLGKIIREHLEITNN